MGRRRRSAIFCSWVEARCGEVVEELFTEWTVGAATATSVVAGLNIWWGTRSERYIVSSER